MAIKQNPVIKERTYMGYGRHNKYHTMFCGQANQLCKLSLHFCKPFINYARRNPTVTTA